MAIGDPWDSSYNPNISNLKNQITGEPVWKPDASDEVSQDSPLTIKNRKRGRFCTEGCGCIDTGCSNLGDGECKLPPEIAVTILRDPSGRYSARSGIAAGEGETIHLKYSNGAWRGSRCCSHDTDGPLEYACDPCKVTTLPNGKPSECHHANNKYKHINAEGQDNDTFETRDEFNHKEALKGGMWPRRGVDAWLKPSGYDQNLPDIESEMLLEDGTTKNVQTWSDEYSRVNIKSVEKTIQLDSDGYVVGFSITNGHEPTEDSDSTIEYSTDGSTKTGCIEDGAVPIKKRPYCRDSITGYRLQQVCSDTQYKNKTDCEAAVDDDGNRVATWLYDDEDTCIDAGKCESPNVVGKGEDKSRSDRVTEHGTQEACEAKFGDGDPSCFGTDGKPVTGNNQETCEANGGIWYTNKFYPNTWVTWEYEKRSCCGERILDQFHPYHTPQTSGGGDNTRKSSICFTPYQEVILSPSFTSGFVGPSSLADGGCTGITNQSDRSWFWQDVESYWTLLIRPCNFWGSCQEEGKPRPDPADVIEGPDNYWETTCGEEVLLYLPVDQFVNCSNFNLTLSQESGLRSGWPESYASWDSRMGSHGHGNPVGDQTLNEGWTNVGQVSTQFGIPGDAIEKDQFNWWCAYPDANFDGIPDGGGGTEHCSQYVYWNSGAPRSWLQNAKGFDNFYGFNMQPQPFKATEEKQNRAKPMYQVGQDHKYWQMCGISALTGHGGGGHWFWDIGPDFFFYYDFAAWDEIGFTGQPGGARQGYVKSGGVCEAASTKVEKYIKSHVGMLARGDCARKDGSAPLLVGWQNTEPGLCPDYSDSPKDECGQKGTCVNDDDTYSQETEADCAASGGKFTACAEWDEGCTVDGERGGIKVQVVTNPDDEQKDWKYRDAVNKAECETEQSEGGAGGRWFEGCFSVADPNADECPDLHPVPEGILSALLGEREGSCKFQKDEQEVVESGLSESECEAKKQEEGVTNVEFAPDQIGSSDSSYDKRIGNGLVKLRPSGPMSTGLANVDGILNGRRNAPYETTEFGLKRNGRLSNGQQVGHSLSYWHETGLYPRGEIASFVNDSCMGVSSGKRIEDAANTNPIMITSRNHGLRDGDLVNTWGVMGNFGANVMSQGEWTETQWEDKLYKKCTGPSCDEPTWPNSRCPHDTKCINTETGEEEESKSNDKFGCLQGTCSKTRADGSKCTSESFCTGSAEKCAEEGNDENCPEGFTPDPNVPPGGECRCVNKLWAGDDDEPLGCEGEWKGGEHMQFQTFCDYDKYYACSGSVIKGEEPPPADFFVVQNTTIDTFDLYTCDKHPVDGRIANKINLDTTECPDESPKVCVQNPDIGTYETVVESIKKSITVNPAESGFGVPTLTEFVQKCVTSAGEDVTQGVGQKSKDTYNGHEVDNAPLSARYTCNGTSVACEEKDCVAVDSTHRWISSENLKDDPLTELEEGEVQCGNYGSCSILENEDFIGDAITQEECILLAKTYKAYYSDKEPDHKDQKYVNMCLDTDGNSDSSEEMVSASSDPDELEKRCKEKHSGCFDMGGQEKLDYLTNEQECVDNGGEWKEPQILLGNYHECVDKGLAKENKWEEAISNCWYQNQWKGSASVTSLQGGGGTGSSFGKPSVGVWRACPFTGQWVLYNNQDDIGIEAGYIGHLGQDEIDSRYRLGLGGPGYKWEDRANDYWVQIEQKGICPVCCDHFMPTNLVATLSEQSSEILNIINCGLEKCTHNPSVGMKAKHDGYCCADDIGHSCDLTDVARCQNDENWRKFGFCKGEDGQDINCIGCDIDEKHTDGKHKGKNECEIRGGTFQASLNGPEDCDKHVRQRITPYGTTNCRRCSDVYSSQHKVPMIDASHPNSQNNYEGETCCPNCECLYNHQDKSKAGCGAKYMDCETAISCLPDCDSSNEGLKKTLGELEAVCKKYDFGGNATLYKWEFDPCSCFPNFVPLSCEAEGLISGGVDDSCEQNGTTRDGISGHENTGGCYDEDGNLNENKKRSDGASESDCSADEEWREGASGCLAREVSTDADSTCYDLPNSVKPVGTTCPGLGTIDVPMEFDGVVWRSDWELMNTVGTHQCDLGQHRFKWSSNCTPEGPTDGYCDPVGGFSSGDELVAVNADCDACDSAQYGGITGGVLLDRLGCNHRNAKPPSLPKDGHFIRLVMGCGASIPSIDAYGTGRVIQGGFDNASRYNDNGIGLWAEITNCTFTDFQGSESQKTDRSIIISGSPPCPGSFCKVIPRVAEGGPTQEQRVYSFAGSPCMNTTNCGPRGACHAVECCTYTGQDFPFHGTGIWHGAIACSQGGDIDHICKASGFDPLNHPPAEQFDVAYVKDVDSVTGEATLVVRTYPPTFGGIHCDYPEGTNVSIGLAELADAEFDTFGSFARDNKSANPYLPAGGTILTEAIPYGDNPPTKDGDRGRGSGEFMEIRVANIAPLVTKNPRKNRHLRIYDRSRIVQGSVEKATSFDDMNMKLTLDLPGPYGLKPWPVDHQTHSDTGTRKWPKGTPHSPISGRVTPTESLIMDKSLSLNQPGRIGPIPTMDNLNRMFRFKEVDTGGGTTTPIPEIMPVEPVMINEFHNVYEYDENNGYCLDSNYKTKDSCETDGKSFWAPKFMYTKVKTDYEHDLSDAEKVVISGSVTYPATCKGARLGFCSCKDGTSDCDKDLNINECNAGTCIDTQLGPTSKWVRKNQDPNADLITTEQECMTASAMKQQQGSTGDGISENKVSIPPLVFKKTGEWIQVYPESTGTVSEAGTDGEDTAGGGDEFICEKVFGGKWVVGTVNDERNKDGSYKDPNNLEPKALNNKNKGFTEGCPVGCRLNGFYLKDPCEPPSEDNPEGQCFECVEIVTVDSDGNETREDRCPLGPADGAYVARMRGCQNSKYNSKKDCEENGWTWWGQIQSQHEFALHNELQIVTHNASQLKYNKDGKRMAPAGSQDKPDWIYDLSQYQQDLTLIDDKASCESVRDAEWALVGNDFQCVNLRRLDLHFPEVFSGENSGTATSARVFDLCNKSDNCEVVEDFKSCMDVSSEVVGECITLDDNNRPILTDLKKKDCSGVFIGPEIATDKQGCLEKPLQDESLDYAAVNDFVCVDMQNQFYSGEPKTPKECTDIAMGTVAPKGKVVSYGKDEDKVNPVTKMNILEELSSPAAIAMGSDVGIGAAPKNFKGVIYAPQVKTEGDYLPENKDHDEYADPHWRAVWSRHGGGFNIVVGKRAPINNCRQANSNKPVNMDFYLSFPQICCNERGPLMYHECGEQCYDHYQGPHLVPMELGIGIHGESVIHVNIHE